MYNMKAKKYSCLYGFFASVIFYCVFHSFSCRKNREWAWRQQNGWTGMQALRYNNKYIRTVTGERNRCWPEKDGFREICVYYQKQGRRQDDPGIFTGDSKPPECLHHLRQNQRSQGTHCGIGKGGSTAHPVLLSYAERPDGDPVR